MIHGVDWRPDNIIVAVSADVRCQDMVLALARRVDAVVATDAVVKDVRVIESGWYPGGRRVAVVTVVAAVDMCRVLARGNGTVVTGHAGSDHLEVIHEIGRGP